jgi:hypothetical protein
MMVRYEIAKSGQRVDSLARDVCIDFHRNAYYWDLIAKQNEDGSMHFAAIGHKLFPGLRSEILLKVCGVKFKFITFPEDWKHRRMSRKRKQRQRLLHQMESLCR